MLPQTQINDDLLTLNVKYLSQCNKDYNLTIENRNFCRNVIQVKLCLESRLQTSRYKMCKLFIYQCLFLLKLVAF